MDRISNINPNRTRVQETEDRGGRGRRDDEEEEKKKKDKDKFDKGKPFWKKLLSDPASKPVRTPRATLAGGTKPRWNIAEREELTPAPPEDEFSDTGSVTEDLSLSQRFLVVAGVLDLSGRPRWVFVLTYALIASVIVVSTLLIFGIIL